MNEMIMFKLLRNETTSISDQNIAVNSNKHGKVQLMQKINSSISGKYT